MVENWTFKFRLLETRRTLRRRGSSRKYIVKNNLANDRFAVGLSPHGTLYNAKSGWLCAYNKISHEDEYSMMYVENDENLHNLKKNNIT